MGQERKLGLNGQDWLPRILRKHWILCYIL